MLDIGMRQLTAVSTTYKTQITLCDFNVHGVASMR